MSKRGLGTLEVQDGGGNFEVQVGGVSSGARPFRRVAEVGGGTSRQHRKGYEFKRERREKYGHLASPPPPTGPVCPAVNVLPCPKPQREISALWDTNPPLSQPSARSRQPQPGARVTREPGHLTKCCRSTQPPHAAWAGASSGQGFRTPGLGCGEDPYHALRGVCMGGGNHASVRGSHRECSAGWEGSYCVCAGRAEFAACWDSRGRCAPHTGVEWDVGGVSTRGLRCTHAHFARPLAAGQRVPGAPRTSSAPLPPAPAPSPARHRAGKASGLRPHGERLFVQAFCQVASGLGGEGGDVEMGADRFLGGSLT